VDKTKLPDKAALAAQIKQEKTRPSNRAGTCERTRECSRR